MFECWLLAITHLDRLARWAALHGTPGVAGLLWVDRVTCRPRRSLPPAASRLHARRRDMLICEDEAVNAVRGKISGFDSFIGLNGPVGFQIGFGKRKGLVGPFSLNEDGNPNVTFRLEK